MFPDFLKGSWAQRVRATSCGNVWTATRTVTHPRDLYVLCGGIWCDRTLWPAASLTSHPAPHQMQHPSVSHGTFPTQGSGAEQMRAAPARARALGPRTCGNSLPHCEPPCADAQVTCWKRGRVSLEWTRLMPASCTDAPCRSWRALNKAGEPENAKNITAGQMIRCGPRGRLPSYLSFYDWTWRICVSSTTVPLHFCGQWGSLQNWNSEELARNHPGVGIPNNRHRLRGTHESHWQKPVGHVISWFYLPKRRCASRRDG